MYYIFLMFFLLFMPSVLANTNCADGYYLDKDTQNCEICPPTHYCSGGEMYDCFFFADGFVIEGTGAKSHEECGSVYKIKLEAGYKIHCSDDIYRKSPCSSGYYCPGGTFTFDEIACDSWGRITGEISCGWGYSDEGAKSESECTPCPTPSPEYSCDTYYGEAQCFYNESITSVEDCAIIRMFFSPETAELFGSEIEFSDNYTNAHGFVKIDNTFNGTDYSTISGFAYICDSNRLTGTNFENPKTYPSISDAIAKICYLDCDDGYVEYNDNCLQICASGITQLNTSTGVSVPLWASNPTTPSLHVQFNNQICYAGLFPGEQDNAININFNNQTYHTK